MLDQTSAAAFEDALEGAVGEAIAEVDTIEGDDVFETEDVTEDAPPSEEAIEDVVVDEEIEAVDDAVDAVEDKEETQYEKFERTGNPDDLPAELVKSYKLMQAGYTKRSQELADMRKDYDSRTKQLMDQMEQQQKASREQSKKPRPSNPTEAMSQEDQNQRWQEISKWETQETINEMIASGALPDPERVNRQLAEQEAAADGQRRFNMIAAKEGYTDDVGQAMENLAKSNQFWANQIVTDEGASACFDFVKTQMAASDFKTQAAKLEEAKVNRSAGANKRATPKPATQSKSVSPVDNFKDLGFEDTLEAIIREDFV
jgi:hypothetical protein